MDPDVWRWVWLGLAFALAAGEIASTGFFLLPFAIGALCGSLLGFAGVGFEWQLLAFAAGSAGSFAALRPLARRLDRDGVTDGVGSRRLIGAHGVALTDIDPRDGGTVRIQRETWRAESEDSRLILAGSTVTVLEVVGTRCLVRLDEIGSGSAGTSVHPREHP